jgi:hypothetical protein
MTTSVFDGGILGALTESLRPENIFGSSSHLPDTDSERFSRGNFADGIDGQRLWEKVGWACNVLWPPVSKAIIIVCLVASRVGLRESMYRETILGGRLLFCSRLGNEVDSLCALKVLLHILSKTRQPRIRVTVGMEHSAISRILCQFGLSVQGSRLYLSYNVGIFNVLFLSGCGLYLHHL